MVLVTVKYSVWFCLWFDCFLFKPERHSKCDHRPTKEKQNYFLQRNKTNRTTVFVEDGIYRYIFGVWLLKARHYSKNSRQITGWQISVHQHYITYCSLICIFVCLCLASLCLHWPNLLKWWISTRYVFLFFSTHQQSSQIFGMFCFRVSCTFFNRMRDAAKGKESEERKVARKWIPNIFHVIYDVWFKWLCHWPAANDAIKFPRRNHFINIPTRNIFRFNILYGKWESMFAQGMGEG